MPKGYGQFWDGTRNVLAHRYSFELNVGPIPDSLQLDHRVTCPKRCVNYDHLRLTTNKQNNENRASAQANSKTGIRGVSWDRNAGKWLGRVKHNGVHIHVGLFPDIEEAERAVIAKRCELFTHNDVDRRTR